MKNHQKGAALIMGLILIAVSSLLVVTSMRGSRMQEMMTSNQNNKLISQTAAEAGAAKFLEWLYDSERSNDLSADWSKEKSKFPDGSFRQAVQFKPFGDYYILNNQNNPDWSKNPVPVIVVGVSRSGKEVLAETRLQLMIEIDSGSADSNWPPAPLTLGGSVKDFSPANSNKFKVIGGEDNFAIVTDNNYPESYASVVNSIPNNRRDNYTGGGKDSLSVAEMDLGLPWSDANALKNFVNQAETMTGSNVYVPGVDKKNEPITESLTSSELFGITVVRGNASMSGNVSGTGLLIVTGNLEWSGNPSFDGLIVVLGGFDISGGGNGGVNGAVYVANVNQPANGDWSFGSTGSVISGGGGATLKYDPNKFKDILSKFTGAGGGSTGQNDFRIQSWSEV